MLVVQAANDFSLGPSEVLGAASSARVFPPYGATCASGHGAFGCLGMDLWGQDVRVFLSSALAT